MSKKQTIKEKISEMQGKADSIKEDIQRAQRNKDQLEGEKKQLDVRQSEIIKKIQEDFGVNTIDELKKKVQEDMSSLEKMINNATNLIKEVKNGKSIDG